MPIYEILSTPLKVLIQILIIGSLTIGVFYGSLCFFCYSQAKLEDNKIVSEALDYIDEENDIPTISDVVTYTPISLDSGLIGIEKPDLKCKEIKISDEGNYITGYLGQPYEVIVTRKIKFFSIFSANKFNLTIKSSGSTVNRGQLNPSSADDFSSYKNNYGYANGKNDYYAPRYELGEEFK